MEQTDRAIARTLQTCYDEEYRTQIQGKNNDMERREALDRTKKEQVILLIYIQINLTTNGLGERVTGIVLPFLILEKVLQL